MCCQPKFSLLFSLPIGAGCEFSLFCYCVAYVTKDGRIIGADEIFEDSAEDFFPLVFKYFEVSMFDPTYTWCPH